MSITRTEGPRSASGTGGPCVSREGTANMGPLSGAQTNLYLMSGEPTHSVITAELSRQVGNLLVGNTPRKHCEHRDVARCPVRTGKTQRDRNRGLALRCGERDPGKRLEPCGKGRGHTEPCDWWVSRKRR